MIDEREIVLRGLRGVKRKILKGGDSKESFLAQFLHCFEDSQQKNPVN